MQSLYFDEIITKGVRAGQIPARTQSARNWYRETAEKITRIRNQDKMINSDPKRATKQPAMLPAQYKTKEEAASAFFHSTPPFNFRSKFEVFRRCAILMLL